MDRQEMDKPAMGVALLLGVALIGVGAAGIVTFDAPLKTYAVSWTALPDAAATGAASLSGAPSTAEATASVTDVPVATAVIALTCDDQYEEQLDQPARFTWELTVERTDGNSTQTQSLDTQEFACDEVPDGGWSVQLTSPGLARIEADSLDGAQEQADGLAERVTATYTLTLTADRPPGTLPPLPLPVGQPALEAQAQLSIYEWGHAVSEDVEVLR